MGHCPGHLPSVHDPRHDPPASLVFDASIKSSLLEYASTAMLFADKHVDSTIISWNRCRSPCLLTAVVWWGGVREGRSEWRRG